MLTKVATHSLVADKPLKGVTLRFLSDSGIQNLLSPSWRLVFRNLIKVFDISFIALAFLLAEYYVPHAASLDRPYLVAGSVGALLAFSCALQGRVYTRQSLQSFTAQAGTILPCLLVGATAQGVVLAELQAAPSITILQWSSAWLVMSAGLILGLRLPLVRYIRHATEHGILARRLAIVGATQRGRQIAEHVATYKEEANHLVGVFDDAFERSAGGPAAVNGSVADLIALSRRERIDAIVIALPQSRFHEIDILRGHFSSVVADVYVVPDIDGLPPVTHLTGADAALTSSLGGSPVIRLIRRPLTDYQSVQKALFDRVIAALAFIALAPVLAMIALAIKLDSRGPVLFRQPRMGFNNVPFTVFKFRSMYHHMTDILADRQTSRDDPRVTRVGRILRKLSLDELPQLLNVMCGDMSLVGPRPHAPSTKAEGYLLDDAVPEYAERHRIKPGITGWAQVNGARGEIKSIGQIEERVKFDLHYIQNWSLFLDIKILFLTVKREIISSRAF